ncbi:MAG: hypothetical protein HY563_03335 [Ignavibacteriales bacterium]|nr:hypothetical protein [Ignavibacteriales bacterium]
MGRTALLLVLGLGAAFAVIGINLRNSGTAATEHQVGYHKYASARNLARTAVHARLRAIDRGESLIGRTDGSFNDGTFYTLVDSGMTLDTIYMNAFSQFAESTYTMRLRLYRYSKPFPMVNSAVGIRASPVDFKLQGSAQIDGRDHDSNGNLTGDPGLPGVAVMTTGDSTTVMNNGGSGGIVGGTKVAVDTTTADPLQFVQEYLNNYDYRYTQADSPINQNIVWGGPDDPKIVVCYTPDTTVSVKFNGNCEGWGILVVHGDLNLAGTFTWHGLVIAYGDQSQIRVTASTGTPKIYGGLIMSGGPNSSFQMKGNVSMNYSSESLEMARWIKKLLAYRIMEWYE